MNINLKWYFFLIKFWVCLKYIRYIAVSLLYKYCFSCTSFLQSQTQCLLPSYRLSLISSHVTKWIVVLYAEEIHIWLCVFKYLVTNRSLLITHFCSTDFKIYKNELIALSVSLVFRVVLIRALDHPVYRDHANNIVWLLIGLDL